MSALEAFFKAHQYTIAALAAISTFAAVVVSLVVTYISLKASHTRLNARASVQLIIHSSLEGQPEPTYLCVSITNRGNLPATLPFAFFYWKLPFARGLLLISPLDFFGDRWFPKRQYPIEINPRQSETVCLSEISVFRKMCREKLMGSNVFDRLRFLCLHAFIVSADGRKFKVRLDRSVRKELRAIWREADSSLEERQEETERDS